MLKVRHLWIDLILIALSSCLGVLIQLFILLSKSDEWQKFQFWLFASLTIGSFINAVAIYFRRKRHIMLPDRKVDQVSNILLPLLYGNLFGYIGLGITYDAFHAWSIGKPLENTTLWLLTSVSLILLTFFLQTLQLFAAQKARNKY